MVTVLMGAISGHTLQQQQLEVIVEDVISVILGSLVSLEITSLALLHIVIIIVFLILSGATKPCNVLVMKHSTDN